MVSPARQVATKVIKALGCSKFQAVIFLGSPRGLLGLS
jgi:hypothetical protein